MKYLLAIFGTLTVLAFVNEHPRTAAAIVGSVALMIIGAVALGAIHSQRTSRK